MATKVTNDRKRNEMKEIMAGVFAKGWKPAEVAAVIGVTPSNISSWKAGKNMGTNDARARLMALPGRDTSFAQEMIEKVVQSAKESLVSQTAKRDKYTTDAWYREVLVAHTESNVNAIVYHTAELARARDEWGVNYHTRNLAAEKAKTPEIIAAEAKTRQGHDVAFMDGVVAKAAKYLKDMEKILVKW